MTIVFQRDTGAKWNSSQWPKLKQSEQSKKNTLHYNPKYKRQPWAHTGIIMIESIFKIQRINKCVQ